MTETPRHFSSPESGKADSFDIVEDFSTLQKLFGASKSETDPQAKNSSERPRARDSQSGDTLVIPALPFAPPAAQDKYVTPGPLSIIPPLTPIYPEKHDKGLSKSSQYAMQEAAKTPEQQAPGKDTAKAGDGAAAFKAGADGKIEINEKDFDKIGPKAAQVLKDAGVTKITITPAKGFDTYEAELKKPLEIAQDPAVDGCRKLKVADKFSADVSREADGSFKLDNIKGLSAETKILFKWQDASVDKIKLKSTPDGKSEITSTGTWNGFSRDNTRVKPGEIFDKAKILFERMDSLRK